MAHPDQVRYFHEATERALGFAAVVRAGDHLHLSGILAGDASMQVADELKGNMAGQIEAIYDTMEATLAKFGATLADVVDEVIYVTDIGALAEAAGARTARYAQFAPPAATALQVGGLFSPDAMIEIRATAHVPGR